MIRKHYIDGLKGIAAIVVFLSHFKAVFVNPLKIDNFVYSIFTDGSLAVYIFLILSGYLVSMSLETKKKYQDVILKRYFRLALPIAVILLLEGVLFAFGAFHHQETLQLLKANDIAIYSYSNVSWLGLIYALFLSPIGQCRGWLDPAWMMKYIFFGTFAVVILKTAIQELTYQKKLIVFILTNGILAFVSAYYVAVICGMFIYEMLQDNILPKKGIASFLAFVGALLAYSYKIHDLLPATLLVFSVEFSGIFRRVLSSKGMVWLGKNSMSIYLIHWPLVCTLSLWMYEKISITDTFLRTGIVFVLTFVLLLFLSNIFSKMIENGLCANATNSILKWLKR